jgi:Nif-specific regulatory protein
VGLLYGDALNTRSDLERTTSERDFYRRLLDLGALDDPAPFLQEALSLVVEITDAKQGYIALYDDSSFTPRWWLAKGFSEKEVKEIRQKISSGIISEAMATGKLINTESALEDPRFQEHESVRLNNILAVLCAPIGGIPPKGVIYLQGHRHAELFTEEDGQKVLLFARHVSPFVNALRLKDREGPDLTKPYRERLKIENLIGRSAVIAELCAQLESAARFAIPVLLTGASGTGKTAFALAIHENSPKARGPFIEINCATLPENLFESELFGAVPGAHSTATRKLEGKIAAAENGTLFLDEIGELPISVQSKLLQFLQSKTYFPLGSNKAEKSNVRLIAATNVDLEAAVTQKKFREDLFFRLNVLPLRIPSLSERREDISLLAKYFCELSCRNYDLGALTLSTSALYALQEAEWPGNVRQLAHLVEAATIRAAMESGTAVERRHIFPSVPEEKVKTGSMTFQEATRHFQKKLLTESLESTTWNISETSRRLDLTRTHIYHLIEAFGLSRSEK